jgi:hypothetical protein
VHLVFLGGFGIIAFLILILFKMGINDMNAEKPKRIRRDWLAIFDKFHQSGQTATAFCLAEGIPQSLFYKRRKEHTSNHQSIRSSLVRSNFIELKSMSASR